MQNQKTVFSRRSVGAVIRTAGNKQETAVMTEITKLSDQALLSQTKLLAQKERNLHIQVLRHLREIESRRLYFSEGYASLFDYAVRSLGYSKGAAFRRINAMRLCRAEPAVEAKLKSGRLSLCAASQLQNFFEKKKREESRLKTGLKKSSESALISQTSQSSQRGLFKSEGGSAPALQEKSGASLPEQEEIGGSAPGQRASYGSAPGQAGGSGQKRFMAGREQAILRERVSSESELSNSSESELSNSSESELSDSSGGGQLRQGASELSGNRENRQINREQIQRQALEAEKRQALERRQKLELIEKAEGRSSRETERLLLEQSPDSKRILRKDQVCFLGEGMFEVKAVIDEANHRKLEKLKFLLSHQNPSMGYGDLLGILLDLGLQKYDPSRRAQQKPSQNRKGAKIKAAAEAEENSGSAPGQAAGRGSAPGQEAGSGSLPGQRASCGSAPGQGAGGGSAPGQAAGRGSAPGQEAGGGSAPGQEAGRGSAPGQEAGRGSALGQGAGRGSAPGQGAGRGSALGQRAGRGSAPGQGAGRGSALGQEAGRGSAPGQRAGRGSALGQANSRYIPAEVKRLVWARDQGRCSYVNPKTGQRCGSRYMLQMDHIEPYALGGRSTKENMRLLCAGHNRFRARQTFPSSARSRPASKFL